MPHVEKQLTYVLKDSASSYDATLKVWKEPKSDLFPAKVFDELNPKNNLQLRVKILTKQIERIDSAVFDYELSKVKPIFQNKSSKNAKTVEAINKDTNTYYYGIENLESEELIKEGHLFVQNINEILKTPTSNLVHGAALGVDNHGILFCARGQRGKSTLAVLSMFKGFEYVSDDYLTIEKKDNKLYASPIYSIITLSPKMYNELYDYLDGTRFVSNNARKDKYVINISKFHNQFKKNYPIDICMFPEIMDIKEPFIVPCEKSRAIVQLIHSTLMQTRDLADTKTVKKIYEMVKDFDFYKIGLCPDIEKNTEFLRNFMKNIDKRDKKAFLEPEIYQDITFNIASFIDTKTFAIYVMNKFATNIYENLSKGVSIEAILNELKKVPDMPLKIIDNVNLFVQVLKEKHFLEITLV